MPHTLMIGTARILIAGILLSTVASLVACSASADESCAGSLDQHFGESLAALSDCIDEESTLVIQDVSPLVGEAASFRDDESRQNWIVVAGCSSDEDWRTAETVEVAVIPRPHSLDEADFTDILVCAW
ncbi:hypothetical protein [Microbacterium sp. SLBN-146]|uniref:hypothetical protein n=1 Tax=Microbacterium sp. SLBN-146 TaxID=2768457 RepID=UPI001151E868|nr:hypothetical protein [Microbacterium sp. SLBN-146]TQJ30467.1 hypothetical protein FBY39_0919 [Microbacterium sp. SLBN-146]